MYSGLIIGHILIVVGCVLITFSLVDMYMKLAALGQGKEPHRSPKWIDGILLLSGLLVAAGGTCSATSSIGLSTIDFSYVLRDWRSSSYSMSSLRGAE